MWRSWLSEGGGKIGTEMKMLRFMDANESHSLHILLFLTRDFTITELQQLQAESRCIII